VNTLLSEDQAELENVCRRLLEREWPLEQALRALEPGGTGHSPELWQTLVDAGWIGYPFPPDVGGGGGDLIELGLIYRAAGERLVPHSFYSAMFAGLLIDALGSEAQKRSLLAPLIAGEHLITVACAEPHAAEETRLFRTRASRVGDRWVLKGTKAFVADAGTAQVLLVLAAVHAVSERLGWGVFAVDTRHLSGRIERTSAFGGVPLFQIDLTGVEIPQDALLGGMDAVGSTLAVYGDTVEKATALQCMEMAGGIGAVLSRTVDYVKERMQFDQPIGSKQAVQHLLANISMHLDGARVAALKALYLKARGLPASKAVSIAKVALGEGYTNATITAQQLWGAMGYARETGLYLWTERAKVTDAWLGTRASHLRRLAAHMGL
jgi:alkylation response protein AidB-like acyl-CoA dehydrogenase